MRFRALQLTLTLCLLLGSAPAVANLADLSLDELLDIEVTLVSRRPVITVGDGEDFVRRGGMVGFVIRSRKVRFLINPDAAAKVGISFSSKLLRIAEIYQP
jgi:hypothetical protein